MTLTFKRLYDSGFKELVSVIPPGASLSPASKIAQDQIGKTPGRQNMAGYWGGYDWNNYTPTPRDMLQWDNARANIGLKAGRYPAVDIDVTNEAMSDMIRAEATRILGKAPIRIGRHPKTLLMFRTEEPFGKMQLRFVDNQGIGQLVEMLADGQQYVIGGIHPATREPYRLDTDIAEAGPDALPLITKAQAEQFFATIAETLETLGCQVTKVDNSADKAVERKAVEQTGLLAPSMGKLIEVVAALPNTSAAFPDRDDYLLVGYAIKAAAGEANVAEAKELFCGWAERWEDAGDNAVETAAHDFDRMYPPYSVGWDFLLEKAGSLGVVEVAKEEFTAVEPPLDAADVVPAPDGALVAPWSDVAMTRRCVRAFGHEIRYVAGIGWLVWNGHVWARDENGELNRRIVQVLSDASAQALTSIDKADKAERIAGRVASASTVAAVAKLLVQPALCFRPEQMDAAHFMINTPAGVVDLTTGEVRKAEASYYMTRTTAVSPDFTRPAPRWKQFLREVTGGDVELESYLQRLAGYALTGSTREHMVAFFYGEGGNGKSLFLNTLTAIMGEYSQVAPMDVFVASTYDRHPTDLAGLVGARLVTASETQEGRRWDEAKLKSLTGGDPIKARFMRQDFFTFIPQFTLLFAGNHAPQLANVDAAMKRRMHLVPFTHKPPKPDHELPDKLREEYPQILAWAVQGAIVWNVAGLCAPDVVLSATEEYLDGEDALGRWLKDRCVVRQNATVFSKDLYQDWIKWCQETGEKAGLGYSQKRFSQALKTRGLTLWRDTASGLRGFQGIELLVGDYDAVTEFAGTNAVPF